MPPLCNLMIQQEALPRLFASVFFHQCILSHFFLQRSSVISKAPSLSPSTSNGSISLPSVPAPVKLSEEVIDEFPSDTGNKATLEDFQFIKVLGKGSFGKVNVCIIRIVNMSSVITGYVS